MPKQEINLFRSFTQPFKRQLSWKEWWYLQAAFLILLWLVFGFSYLQFSHLKKQQNHFSVQVDRWQGQLVQTQKQFPPEFFSQGLPTLFNQLQEQLQLQKNIFKETTNSVPFSTYLAALARIAIPQQVWLTHFAILEGGKKIILQGQSFDSALISTYLNKMTQDEFLLNYKFIMNKMEKNLSSSNKDSIFSFEIAGERKE